MAVEDAAEDHEPQRAPGEDEHLVEAQHAAVLGVVEELGVGRRARGTGVEVDHHLVVLAGAPERLVVVVGVAGKPRGDRHGGQHHAAEDAVGPRPRHLLDGAVHVVEVDRHAAGPSPGGGGAEVGQPAHVAVQRRPHHLEPLVGRRAEVHRRRQAPGQDGPGQGHLGVDPLLLEHREPAAVAVAGHHPVRAVVGQPAPGGVGVDPHAGQAPGRGRPHGIGLVHLAGIEAAEHGDGQRRHVPEGGDRLAVGRVDVGEEVVEAVRRGVGVGRDDDVVPPGPVAVARSRRSACSLTHRNRPRSENLPGQSSAHYPGSR